MSSPPDHQTEEEPEGTALDDRSARNLVVGLAVAIEGGMILLALLLGWLFEINPLGRFSLDWKGAGWGLLATLPMLAAFLLAIRRPVGPLRSIAEFTDRHIRPIMWPCSLIDLVGISVLAGLGEEMLFRGFLQDVLVEWRVPWWGAVLAAGALFGLLHAVTPSYAVLAAVMGAYLGLVYHYSDNLLSAAVAHGAYDLAALIYITRGPGSDMPPLGEEQGDEG